MGTGQVVPLPKRDQRIEDISYAALFDRRVIFLRGEIKSSVADDVAAQLLALDALGDDPVTLYIDSPGGEMPGLFTIHDTMKLVRAPVRTVCLGLAASAAAVILATGTGGRAATPNARIMLHQPHGGVGGQARDIEIQAKEILYLRGRMEEILAGATGRPLDRIRTDTDRDFWLSAEEARAYGVIDEVLGPEMR